MKRTIIITAAAALALSLAFAYGPRFQNAVAPAGRAGTGQGQIRAGAILAGTLHDEAASLLGITADELVTLRQSGKTLADVASDLGQNVDQFQAQLVAARNDAIDQAVQAGDVTEAQAAMLKTRTEAVVAARLKAPTGPNAASGYGPASGVKVLNQRVGRGGGYGMNAGAPGAQNSNRGPQFQQYGRGGWR